MHLGLTLKATLSDGFHSFRIKILLNFQVVELVVISNPAKMNFTRKILRDLKYVEQLTKRTS